ncbi:MAG TPA: saccharopine dehydrogenase NADP-binding domain-containing protein [Sphingomicrobium sp.]|nr:saccharopine dehydrogenase NADP-binding domain-containing protein [Sphingomicrobium sp.]
MPDEMPLCILLLGASGVFGSRLAERLAPEPGIALTLAGRRRESLVMVRDRIGGGAIRILDRDWIEARDLAGYDMVIDAAGPFQNSGTRLVEAALEAGIDYVDLADGREWVVGFAERFDRRARLAGVRLVTGASSIPALSHAVLDELTAGWQRIDTIRIGIFPGNRAPRGLSVVEAILSYAGKPFRVFRNGEWRDDWGWGRLHRTDAGPAGKRWASACDTPEQDLLVNRYKPSASAEFFAGMELSILHVGLWLLSLPVRGGWIRSLRPWSKPLLTVARWLLPFGTDKGAMLVEATGIDGEGKPVAANWRLNADGNRGPYVPVLAAVALARRWRDGGTLEAGARACTEIIELEEFDQDFGALGIATQTAFTAPQGTRRP